ncbi:MAG: LamG domain-containing protein [Candidatus Poribacteria bacterium]
MKKIIFLMVFCILLTFGLVAMAADPNLIVYLPMNDGSGDVVKDLSPNKLDGKIVGKDFKWVDAKKGKGLDITSGTEIQIPDNALLDGMKALTIELWVKMDTHQATRLVDKGTSWDQLSYLIQPWSDQQIYFGIFSTAARAITPAGSYTLKTWFHLAAVFNGTDLILYIDGVEKSRAKSPVNQVPDTPEPLEIARGTTGTVDEFAFYNRALTLAEVTKDMNGIAAAAVNSVGSLTTTWGQLKH